MELLHQYLEAWRQADYSLFAQTVAADAQHTIAPVGVLPLGPLGVQMYAALLQETFEPLVMQVMSQQIDGCCAKVHCRFSGVHTAEFMEVEPTLRFVVWEAWLEACYHQGLVVEACWRFDWPGLLGQIRTCRP